MNVRNLEGFDRSIRKEIHSRSAIVRRVSRDIFSPERLESRQLLTLVVENQMVPVGSAITGTIANFDAADLKGNLPEKVQATVDWGNGTSTIASIGPLTSGKYDVTIPADKRYVYPVPASFPSFKTVTVRLRSTDTPPQPVDLSSDGCIVIVPSSESFRTTIQVESGKEFSEPVGYFFDFKSSGQFSAMINWGDGTSSEGKIVNLGDSKYQVNGTHTYFEYLKPEGLPISITVFEKNSAAPFVKIESRAKPKTAILDSSFEGSLAHTSDTGPSDNDNITNTTFPVFEGNAVPYSVILLYGRRFDYKQDVLLGRTVAGVDGRWQITAGPLADGHYVITGSMTTPSGQVVQKTFCSDRPSASQPGPLLIDTVGLTVVRIQRRNFNVSPLRAKPRSGMVQLMVYFEPDLSGIDTNSLVVQQNYALQQRFHENIPLKRPDVQNDNGRFADFIRVDLNFANAEVDSAAKLRISGVQDMAGNNLSGVFPINTRAYLTRKLPLR